MLRVACRTTSSGDGLEVLHKLCGNPGIVMFAAANEVTNPITISLTTGAWPQGWGVGITISVVNAFKVCDASTDDLVERRRLNVSFHFRRRLRECVPDKMSLSNAAVGAVCFAFWQSTMTPSLFLTSICYGVDQYLGSK